MRIDLLRRRALVEAHKPVQEVVARRVVVVPAVVVGEVVALRGKANTLVYHRWRGDIGKERKESKHGWGVKAAVNA
jgi:hypothetical protein